MNDRTFHQSPTDDRRGPRATVVADAAGGVWAHSNPAELYRWVSRRNDLLGTIAAAFRRPPSRPMMAG